MKWVIHYQNKLVKADFVDLNEGMLTRKNYVGPYEYERTNYYEPEIYLFSQAWALFCKKYFTGSSIGQLNNLDEPPILFELLINTVREMDIQTENVFLQPMLKNVIFIGQSGHLEFIYLNHFEEIDIVSLTYHNGGI